MVKKVQSTTILLSVVVKLFLSATLSLNLKQPTFCDATTRFSAKCRLRNVRRNSILITCHYSDQSSASDWSCREGNLLQPIRSTTQILVVTRHQYGISPLVPGLILFGNQWWAYEMSVVFPGYTSLLLTVLTMFLKSLG